MPENAKAPTPDPWTAAVTAAVDRAFDDRWEELLEAVGSRSLPKLLDTNETSKWLQVAPASLKKFRDEGMPFIRLGELYRYDPVKVKAWLDAKSEGAK